MKQQRLFKINLGLWCKWYSTDGSAEKSWFESSQVHKSGHKGVIARELSQWIYPDVGRERIDFLILFCIFVIMYVP